MARRLGRDDSASRTALMDAVETIMRRNGYAQLSARKIAEVAGLNYQLVFYYFEKIEDLFLETYRRRTSQMLKRYQKALKSPQPLRALWALATNRTDGVLSIEYMAMSNHYESIRTESIRHVQNIRNEIRQYISENDHVRKMLGDDISLVSLAILIGNVGNYISFQRAQGIYDPELGVEKLVERFFDYIELEPDAPKDS